MNRHDIDLIDVGRKAGAEEEREAIVRFLLQKRTIDNGTAWAAMEIKAGRHKDDKQAA